MTLRRALQLGTAQTYSTHLTPVADMVIEANKEDCRTTTVGLLHTYGNVHGSAVVGVSRLLRTPDQELPHVTCPVAHDMVSRYVT